MGQIAGTLGSVNFSTGAYVSTLGSGVGSIATFTGGGTFQIMGNGSFGIPNGVIFSGSFSGPVTLTETAMSSTGGDTYLLSGQVSGTWYNGSTVSGATSQIYIFTGKNGWMGTSTLGSGDTIITTVPEPGTLGLLGTGLFGLAGPRSQKAEGVNFVSIRLSQSLVLATGLCFFRAISPSFKEA